MKLLIIPDLHGDFEEFFNILSSFSIINISIFKLIEIMFQENRFFSSYFNFKNIKIIQLGDILDSKMRVNIEDKLKYDDMFLFFLFNKLKECFKDNIIMILGNHELFNYYNIFDYKNKYSKRPDNIKQYIKRKIKENFLLSYKENKFCFVHSTLLNSNDENKYLNYIKENDVITTKKFDELYDNLFFRRINGSITNDYSKYELIFFGHTIPEDNKILKIRNEVYLDQGISKSFFSLNNPLVYDICFINNGVVSLKELKRININIEDTLNNYKEYLKLI